MKKEFFPSEISSKPGVYIFRDRFGRVIYVGKAINLRRRLSSYFQESQKVRADAKLRSLINSIYDWSVQEVRNENEALILESRLIKRYAPRYNILMRDDKRYPLLKINLSDKFPTLKMARVQKNDGAEYFGPFPQGGALRDTLEFLLSYFGLRACKTHPNEDTMKRCLKRIVKDCSAPCVGKVSETEYREIVEKVLSILSGDISELKDDILEKMEKLSIEKKYEQAAKLRDVLNNLDSVFGAKNRTFIRATVPVKDIGLEGVKELKAKLGLPKEPNYIVCFDNSNLFGEFAVSSQVAFRNGRPDRRSYRRFRVRSVKKIDDYDTMREVIERFFSRLLADNQVLPDLVIVDGGKGQLNAAIESLIKLECPPLPVISLAEKNEEVFIPGRKEAVIIDPHSCALKLLQAIRDESHRFALMYHRKLRDDAIENSILDDIPGIGDIRKKDLLRAFGSVKELRKAKVSEIIEKVPGMGQKMSETIKKYLNK